MATSSRIRVEFGVELVTQQMKEKGLSKSWYALNESLSSIGDLTLELVKYFSLEVPSSDLHLISDGFALPHSCHIRLLRDGDVVVVSCASQGTQPAASVTARSEADLVRLEQQGKDGGQDNPECVVNRVTAIVLQEPNNDNGNNDDDDGGAEDDEGLGGEDQEGNDDEGGGEEGNKASSSASRLQRALKLAPEQKKRFDKTLVQTGGAKVTGSKRLLSEPYFDGKRMRYPPSQQDSEKPCYVCRNKFEHENTIALSRMREHVGAHILCGDVSPAACGFCGQEGSGCETHLKSVSKGVMRPVSTCPYFFKFSHKALHKVDRRMARCTNAPLQCCACEPSTTYVWKYNMLLHWKSHHKELMQEGAEVPAEYAVLPDEVFEVKRRIKRSLSNVDGSEAEPAPMFLSKRITAAVMDELGSRGQGQPAGGGDMMRVKSDDVKIKSEACLTMMGRPMALGGCEADAWGTGAVKTPGGGLDMGMELPAGMLSGSMGPSMRMGLHHPNGVMSSGAQGQMLPMLDCLPLLQSRAAQEGSQMPALIRPVPHPQPLNSLAGSPTNQPWMPQAPPMHRHPRTSLGGGVFRPLDRISTPPTLNTSQSPLPTVASSSMLMDGQMYARSSPMQDEQMTVVEQLTQQHRLVVVETIVQQQQISAAVEHIQNIHNQQQQAADEQICQIQHQQQHLAEVEQITGQPQLQQFVAAEQIQAIQAQQQQLQLAAVDKIQQLQVQQQQLQVQLETHHIASMACTSAAPAPVQLDMERTQQVQRDTHRLASMACSSVLPPPEQLDMDQHMSMGQVPMSQSEQMQLMAHQMAQVSAGLSASFSQQARQDQMMQMQMPTMQTVEEQFLLQRKIEEVSQEQAVQSDQKLHHQQQLLQAQEELAAPSMIHELDDPPFISMFATSASQSFGGFETQDLPISSPSGFETQAASLNTSGMDTADITLLRKPSSSPAPLPSSVFGPFAASGSSNMNGADMTIAVVLARGPSLMLDGLEGDPSIECMRPGRS